MKYWESPVWPKILKIGMNPIFKKLIANKIEENIELEYKGSDSLGKSDGKKTEMSKDISSFANSAGGTLIYGIAETNGRSPNIPELLDGIDSTDFSKEWLEQVINSRIKPRIDGVIINPVNLTGPSEGQVAYVVAIPQGSAAHQASDHRYYKRFNFQSVPMEHYEIVDVMNRAAQPVVVAKVSTVSPSTTATCDITAHLSIRLANLGQVVADRVSIQFRIPDGFGTSGGGKTMTILQRSGRLLEHNGTMCREYLYYHKQRLGIYPLFPGTDEEILDGNYAYLLMIVTKQKEHDSIKQYMEWVVNADNAMPVEGSINMYELFHPEG